MSHTVEYLPVATATGANVDTQANFQGSGYQLDGFTNGTAWPYQFNKILRQASMVAAALTNIASSTLNTDVLDDGNLGNLITLLTNMISTLAQNAQNRVVSVPFSATPTFDASQGSTFVMVLTGNVTSSTLSNVQPGQTIKFIIKQDATGGRTFVAPANLPMGSLPAGPNQVSTQTFSVDNGTNLYAMSGVMVQP